MSPNPLEADFGPLGVSLCHTHTHTQTTSYEAKQVGNIKLDSMIVCMPTHPSTHTYLHTHTYTNTLMIMFHYMTQQVYNSSDTSTS